jgi:transcriptional regulator with XRE-family HTH domain
VDYLLPDRSKSKPGAILKALRKQRHWTLSEVSKRTGLPVSSLSKLENDKGSMTYDTLLRLCDGLEIDIGLFFNTANSDQLPQEVTGRRSITRAGEGKSIETTNYNYFYLTSDFLHKRMIPMIGDIHARSLDTFGTLITHPGEEYAYVLEGSVDLHTSLYAPLRLERGDSIYFDSTMGHAYINVGDGTCRILSVCTASESQLRDANHHQHIDSELAAANMQE